MSFFKNKVVFCRHGKTDWNKEKRTMGNIDIPLSKEGILQAQETAENLSNCSFDLIIASPKKRCIQTAGIIAKRLNIQEIITQDNFTERNLGVLQGLTNLEAKNKYPFLFKEGKFDYNSIVPKGESVRDFIARIKGGIEEGRPLFDSKKVLVITHHGVLTAVFSIIKNMDFNEVAQKYTFSYAEIIEI